MKTTILLLSNLPLPQPNQVFTALGFQPIAKKKKKS